MNMSETNQQNCSYHYTVRRGDSFYLIAHRSGVALRDLLEANPDIPPARLTVGDVLCIPSCPDAEKPAEENGAPTPETPPAETPAPEENAGYVCPANRRAVVQEGQTVSDLQLRYNLSYHTLKTANNGMDLENLNGGDILCLPEENIPCTVPQTLVLGEGDTLESIAFTYGITVAALLRANPCLAPEDFAAGVTVRLPEA